MFLHNLMQDLLEKKHDVEKQVLFKKIKPHATYWVEFFLTGYRVVGIWTGSESYFFGVVCLYGIVSIQYSI